jgi:hypothetical protein
MLGYMKLKEEALYRTLWETHFWKTTEWMNEWKWWAKSADLCALCGLNLLNKNSQNHITCFTDLVYCDLNCLSVSTLVSQYIPLYQYITLFYSRPVLLTNVVHTVTNVTCTQDVHWIRQGHVMINNQKRVYRIYYMSNFQKLLIFEIPIFLRLIVTI